MPRARPLGEMAQYDLSLLQGFWTYAERRNLVGDLDRSGACGSRPPVFTSRNADRNLLQNPTASPAQRLEVIRQIPRSMRHRWFGSMRSSQALAQSVFGNLKVFGLLDALNSVVTENGTALLGAAPLDVQLEYSVGHLGERAAHQTQLDVLITTANGSPVALECKLCEREVGQCSRTKLTPAEPDYCDGTYTLQCARSVRCSLTNLGIGYWEHIPKLFRWKADDDLRPCPLKETYQLVRNVLATGIDKWGAVQPGHVVVIYDDRNPAFHSGRGSSAFDAVHAALYEPNRLRKCSWQTLVRDMRTVGALHWLTEQLHAKYGF
jgi:hypothetical protein